MNAHEMNAHEMNAQFGNIRLGNKRAASNYKPEIDEVVISIDRPHPLGNTFSITDTRSREEVIELFRKDLKVEMQRRQGPRYRAILEIVEHLIAGRDVILMCWCRPLHCHGEVIIDEVKRLLIGPAIIGEAKRLPTGP